MGSEKHMPDSSQCFAIGWKVLRRTVLLLMVLGLIAFYVSSLGSMLNFPQSSDFYKFYLSGERLGQGLSMYWESPLRMMPGDPCFVSATGQATESALFSRACLHPNLNPPFFAALAWPLAYLSYANAWVVWCVINICCGLFSVWWVMRTYLKVPWDILLERTVLVWIIFFAYFPTYAALTYGQVTLFMLPMVVLSWSSLRSGREMQAGVWLGLALSLKPFFGVFILTFLIAQRWRAAVWCVLTGSIAAGLGLFLVGWDDHVNYLRVAREVTWLAVSWNGSFAGYFSRIFGGSENVPWLYTESLGRILTVSASLLTLIAVALLIFRVKRWFRSDQVDVLFAMTMPAMLLISPLGWLYYFPFLFLGFLVTWRLSAQLKSRRFIEMTLLGLLAVTAIPRALEPARTMNSAYFWFFGGAIYHYALLVLLVATAVAVWQASRRSDLLD